VRLTSKAEPNTFLLNFAQSYPLNIAPPT